MLCFLLCYDHAAFVLTKLYLSLMQTNQHLARYVHQQCLQALEAVRLQSKSRFSSPGAYNSVAWYASTLIATKIVHNQLPCLFMGNKPKGDWSVVGERERWSAGGCNVDFSKAELVNRDFLCSAGMKVVSKGSDDSTLEILFCNVLRRVSASEKWSRLSCHCMLWNKEVGKEVKKKTQKNRITIVKTWNRWIKGAGDEMRCLPSPVSGVVLPHSWVAELPRL